MLRLPELAPFPILLSPRRCESGKIDLGQQQRPIIRRRFIIGSRVREPPSHHLAQPSRSPLDRDVDYRLVFDRRGQFCLAGELFAMLAMPKSF